MKFKTWKICKINQVWVPLISKLLFQLFLTQKSGKWKPYWKWSSQERFTIGKYAAINDPAAAAKKLDQRADQLMKVL